MKSSVLWGLVGLNAVLLFMFIGQFSRSNIAAAQVRRPSDYLLIPGELQQGLTEGVFIVDTNNGMLGAMAYDDTSHQLQVMPSINLNTVLNGAGVPTVPTK